MTMDKEVIFSDRGLENHIVGKLIVLEEYRFADKVLIGDVARKTCNEILRYVKQETKQKAFVTVTIPDNTDHNAQYDLVSDIMSFADDKGIELTVEDSYAIAKNIEKVVPGIYTTKESVIDQEIIEYLKD